MVLIYKKSMNSKTFYKISFISWKASEISWSEKIANVKSIINFTQWVFHVN